MLQVVANVWRILDAFTPENPVRTLPECAAISGLTKSSAYRLILSLEEIEFVERAEVGWRLGPRVVELATRRLGNHDLRRDAAPRLAALCQRVRAAGAFSIPDGSDMVYLDRYESPEPFMTARLGARARLWAGASGRAVLAALPDDERPVYLEVDDWKALDGKRQAKVLKELDDARQRGYAIQRGISTPGIAGVAAAIRNGAGRPVAAVALTLSPERLASDGDALGPEVVRLAKELEHGINPTTTHEA
jgi:DNA-binding IclR family transcriptional regulator